MKVITLCPFYDAASKNKLRKAGSKFECSEERARHLVALRLVMVDRKSPKDEAPSTVESEEETKEQEASEKTE